MILKPESREQLAAELASAASVSRPIKRVDLSLISKLVEHAPEDMTATVEGGMTLQEFQRIIQRNGQWLPIDPPGADKLTIADLLAFDLNGSRRCGYGVVRDYLIGTKVALADGQIIKAGGKVVKNVAGYDLCKLFIGARHSLGIIVEATFKLRPLPEKEVFMQTQIRFLQELKDLVARKNESVLEPILFDGHNLDGKIAAVIAFAGMNEDVDSQVAIAEGFGFGRIETPAYLERFWDGSAPQKISVLPSKVISSIEAVSPTSFLAQLSNGILYYRGGAAQAAQPMPIDLMDRVKRAYDPKNIFPRYA